MKKQDTVEYISVRQLSELWGISASRIQIVLKQGRIPGAFFVGNSWAIPADAERPKDKRIKSGKYIKTNRVDLKQEE